MVTQSPAFNNSRKLVNIMFYNTSFGTKLTAGLPMFFDIPLHVSQWSVLRVASADDWRLGKACCHCACGLSLICITLTRLSAIPGSLCWYYWAINNSWRRLDLIQPWPIHTVARMNCRKVSTFKYNTSACPQLQLKVPSETWLPDVLPWIHQLGRDLVVL